MLLPNHALHTEDGVRVPGLTGLTRVEAVIKLSKSGFFSDLCLEEQRYEFRGVSKPAGVSWLFTKSGQDWIAHNMTLSQLREAYNLACELRHNSVPGSYQHAQAIEAQVRLSIQMWGEEEREVIHANPSITHECDCGYTSCGGGRGCGGCSDCEGDHCECGL